MVVLVKNCIHGKGGFFGVFASLPADAVQRSAEAH